MIEEVDETLRAIVKDEALKGAQVEVSFEAPTKDWAARRNAPVVNLYLYDIREDMSRRDAAWAPVYDDDGFVRGHAPAPRHYKLQYMVTAWTQRPEDEHRLLSACLSGFLRHETLAPAEMAGSLAEQSLSATITIALPLGPDRSIADVWSALGGEMKPSLDLIFSAPFVVGRSVTAGAPVMEPPRFSIGRPDAAPETPNRPGEKAAEIERKRLAAEAVRRAGRGDRDVMRRKGPLSPADLPVAQDETVYAGQPKKPGRVLRVRGYPRS